MKLGAQEAYEKKQHIGLVCPCSKRVNEEWDLDTLLQEWCFRTDVNRFRSLCRECQRRQRRRKEAKDNQQLYTCRTCELELGETNFYPRSTKECKDCKILKQTNQRNRKNGKPIVQTKRYVITQKDAKTVVYKKFASGRQLAEFVGRTRGPAKINSSVTNQTLDLQIIPMTDLEKFKRIKENSSIDEDVLREFCSKFY